MGPLPILLLGGAAVVLMGGKKKKRKCPDGQKWSESANKCIPHFAPTRASMGAPQSERRLEGVIARRVDE